MQNRYPRNFYCDAGLWQALERLAYERQRPVDDLIEEAIHHLVSVSAGVGQPAQAAPTARPPPRTPGAGYAPPPPPPAPPAPAPVPMQRTPPPPAAAQRGAAPQRPLFLDYQGYRYPVQTERFIIGRSRKECDLAIADTNISRQHAVIEWFNGCFHIVDMGSTNGIEFHGQRVYRRIIRDGDVFHVAGHELRFSFG